MNKLIYIFALALMPFVSSCNKDIHKMEVVKDCTGVYLRDSSGNDHYVCNEEILANYATGTTLKVSYDKLEECFGLIETPTCEMLHLHSGVIEVTVIH